MFNAKRKAKVIRRGFHSGQKMDERDVDIHKACPKLMSRGMDGMYVSNSNAHTKPKTTHTPASPPTTHLPTPTPTSPTRTHTIWDYSRHLSVFFSILLFIFGYFFLQGVFGDTRIGITLRINPALENGLVHYWTFDLPDMDLTNYTAEIRDSVGANHGDYEPPQAYTGGGAASTTARNASTLVNTADATNCSAGGQFSWKTTSNAEFSDGSYADLDHNSFDSGIISNRFDATNFGFDLPAGSDITGVTLEAERFSAVNVSDHRVHLIVGGTLDTTENKASGTQWATSDPNSYIFYGGSLDEWSISGGLSEADVEATNFGISICVVAGANNSEADIDHVRVTIAYLSPLVTVGGATSTSAGRIGQSILFDGVDDWIDFGDIGSGINTIAFWVKMATTTANINILDMDGTDDRIETNSSSNIVATGFPSATVYVNGSTADTRIIDTNTWYHVVIVDSTGETASAFTTGTSTTYFTGKLDDIRIYNRQLSTADILRLYGLGATTRIGKTLDTNPQLKSGLFGHWSFDGGTLLNNVADISGQGNDGNLVNVSATSTSPGAIGQSIVMDGVDDYIDWGNISGTAKTVAFWVKMATTTANINILDIDGTDKIETNGSSNIVATSFPAATVYVNGTTDINIANTNTWYHVAVTTSGVTPTALTTGMSTTYFSGRMDDLRIYDRELPLAEILRLYQLGATTKINTTITTNPDLQTGLTGHWTFDGSDIDTSLNTAEILDRSDNNYSGDWIDHATTTRIGIRGQAIDFDGVNDYINWGTISGTQKTIAFWVRMATTTASINILDIDGTDRINTDSGGIIQATSFPAATIYVDGSSTSALINDMKWHHVVITDTTGVTPTAFTTGISTTYFAGRLDDVRMYDRVLSPDEVNRLYEE